MKPGRTTRIFASTRMDLFDRVLGRSREAWHTKSSLKNVRHAGLNPLDSGDPFGLLMGMPEVG